MSFKLPSPEEIEASRLKREQEEKLERMTCCFTGHRPDKLGGCYSLKHPESIKISKILYQHLEHLYVDEGIRRFISGGAIGFDQIAFWTAQKLKTKYNDIINIVAVPFKNQACKWTDKKTTIWYNKMLEVADEVVYVDELDKYKVKDAPIGDYHIAKMQKGNEYMVDQSRIVFACHDGSKGGTGNCVNYATRLSKTLYRINPNNEYRLEVRYGMFH